MEALLIAYATSHVDIQRSVRVKKCIYYAWATINYYYCCDNSDLRQSANYRTTIHEPSHWTVYFYSNEIRFA